MRTKDKDKFRLVIDAFTPDTLPMERLAEYLKEFASLLGNEANVHFDKVEKNCAALASFSDRTVTPKIRRRLEEVIEGSAPKTAIKSNSTIDEMMRADNAAGYVDFGGKTKLIEFPGRKRAPQQRIGPVQRRSVIEGQIFQIGGKDETINVHLCNPQKPSETYRAEVSISLARKLMPYFLVGKVRLFGEADWYRTDAGWLMSPNSFTAVDFAPLVDCGLDATIKSAHDIFANVRVNSDLLEDLRNG
jgi:hypothetical protein